MNQDALNYHYAVIAGTTSGAFTSWLQGKRLQRIAITCGDATTAQLRIFLHGSPPTTPYQINIAANEKLVITPEGTGTGDIGVNVFGPNGKWILEAWEPA